MQNVTLTKYVYGFGSSGCSVRVGPGKMKSIRPPFVTIVFMTYFYRASGHGSLGPSGSATVWSLVHEHDHLIYGIKFHSIEKNTFYYLTECNVYKDEWFDHISNIINELLISDSSHKQHGEKTDESADRRAGTSSIDLFASTVTQSSQFCKY